MRIDKEREGEKLTLAVIGRLDTTTAPELSAALDASLEDVKELILDLGGLEYISSAGLRVLLGAQRRMNKQGSMKLVHVNELVMEVFEVTGFSTILNIE
ncbi:MAG: STAS domain-containing protein [Firmicutes bacterium]|nr:STAS domain-containing protein [Bacillota bacterium]